MEPKSEKPIRTRTGTRTLKSMKGGGKGMWSHTHKLKLHKMCMTTTCVRILVHVKIPAQIFIRAQNKIIYACIYIAWHVFFFEHQMLILILNTPRAKSVTTGEIFDGKVINENN